MKMIRIFTISTYKIKFILFLIIFYLSEINALYEDQVGKFDWRQQYIGRVEFAHFEHTVGNLRIIVGTEENVVASVNPRTGQIIWRETMEKNQNLNALVGGNEIISVSGDGTLLRSWEAASGSIKWETSLALAKPEEYHKSYFFVDQSREVLVVVWAVPNSHVEITQFNYKTSNLVDNWKVSTSWLTDKSSCSIVASSNFVCVDDKKSVLNILPLLQKSNKFNETSLQSLGLQVAPNEYTQISSVGETLAENKYFSLKTSNNHFYLLQMQDSKPELIADFTNVHSVSLIDVDGEAIIFIATLENNVIKFKAYNINTKSFSEDVSDELNIPRSHGKIDKMFVYAILKKFGGIGYRLLLTTESNSLLLLQQPGKVVWAREESLASILSVEMVDLPLSESEAQFEKEFSLADGNIILMFIRRLTSQLLRLQSYLIGFIQSPDSSVYSANMEPILLTRDDFNIHKIIVVATTTGKLFGIDSQTGTIVWRFLVPNFVPLKRFHSKSMPLFVQRTTAHYPFTPQCLAVGQNKLTGETMLYYFNPITGLADPDSGSGIVQLSYKIIQSALLPHQDENFIRGLLLLDEQKQVHVFPASSYETALRFASSSYIFVADPGTGIINGYSLGFSTERELIAGEVWKVRFSPSTQAITNVVPKRSSERVHSQGRVMGDRSVLYKYLNPNLVVVTAEENAGSQKGSFHIHLIDSVTGATIFSCTHKRAKGPIRVVHSENWIVYTFQSEKSRRIEVGVIELYEGRTQSNTTIFSSLEPPPPPIVERQGYIFPSSVESLSVTITEKGITNKHILFVLPTGGIVELPKALLDPRRPLIPTQEHREEGVIPYIPELPIIPENFINYNQSVFRISGIYTAPTSLESTCLVLAYGLDLFFTRVTPSKTFDVLKDDFDHILISGVLLALMIGSYLTKRLAARKALKQAWK